MRMLLVDFDIEMPFLFIFHNVLSLLLRLLFIYF